MDFGGGRNRDGIPLVFVSGGIAGLINSESKPTCSGTGFNVLRR